VTTATRPKAKRYPCARCGRRDKAERMVFSRTTGNRYCRAGECKDERRKAKA
jgi:hypothetical protein